MPKPELVDIDIVEVRGETPLAWRLFGNWGDAGHHPNWLF